MRVDELFPRTTLPVDYVKRVIDEAAKKNIRVISFTGGEPLLFLNELKELIDHAGKAGIEYIRTGTNGFLFRNHDSAKYEYRIEKLAEALAGAPLRNFWISIDSAIPPVHEKMRGLPGVIAGIEKALPIFHDHGIYPSANLGINRNIGGQATSNLMMDANSDPASYISDFYREFRSAFRAFYRFVSGLGFTMVNTCYPMSVEETGRNHSLSAVYPAASSNRVVSFTDMEKAAIFKALFHTLAEFRPRIRIFSPRSSLYALYKRYLKQSENELYGCRGGIDFLYMDAKDGNIYPCGYRGKERLGTINELDSRRRHLRPDCRQCDWECFRDPSELFGPIFDGIFDPGKLIGDWRKDSTRLRIWLEDLRYYHACDLFDGRTAPDFTRLAKFR